MTTEKIFCISGREISKANSKKFKEKNAPRVSSFDASNKLYWYGLHVPSILCACGLAISIPTLIPRNNSILEQAYWYEFIIPGGVGSIILAAGMMLDLLIFTSMDSLKSIHFFFKVSMVSLLTWIGTYCVGETFWTKFLEYNHPVPWIYAICTLTSIFSTAISLWILSPANALAETDYTTKLKHFFQFNLAWNTVLSTQISILTTIFNKLEGTDLQCIMAIIIPASKICNTRLFSRIVHKISGMENEKANVAITLKVNIIFGKIVATKLVAARNSTFIGMIVVELILQLIMSYRIIKSHQKVTSYGDESVKREKRKTIMKLVLAELCEGLVPLTYAICFAMAYYGPNAELIGNVRNGYWQYKIVDDASSTFLVMLGLFTMDLVCLSLNAYIIKIYGDVNIFKEVCIVLEKYWYIMALELANAPYHHFLLNDINGAMDLTLKFDWIINGQNNQTNPNSTII